MNHFQLAPPYTTARDEREAAVLAATERRAALNDERAAEFARRREAVQQRDAGPPMPHHTSIPSTQLKHLLEARGGARLFSSGTQGAPLH